MNFKAAKDEKYSKLLRESGSLDIVDADGTFQLEAPDWLDPARVRRGQLFTLKNFNAFITAMWSTIISIASEKSIHRILTSTKKSSTEASAYRRYKLTQLHSRSWLSKPFKPGTKAWRSFEMVRNFHIEINRKAKKNDTGYINQKDMALTQFLYIGYQVSPFSGIHGNAEELEDYNHLVRAIGYMLGIKDEYNLCGETFQETLGRIEAVKQDIFRLNMMNVDREHYSAEYGRTAINGMWYSDPLLNFDSTMFQTKRALRIPGYYYFESERQDCEPANSNMQNLRKLPYFSRMRLFLSISCKEYLTRYAFFRYVMLFIRLSLGIFFDVFPVLLICKFGWSFMMADRRQRREIC